MPENDGSQVRVRVDAGLFGTDNEPVRSGRHATVKVRLRSTPRASNGPWGRGWARGFRIEIKGDKERLKKVMRGFGGPWGRRHHRGPGWGMRWGPFGFGMGPMPIMGGHMAVCCPPWDLEFEEEEVAESEEAEE